MKYIKHFENFESDRINRDELFDALRPLKDDRFNIEIVQRIGAEARSSSSDAAYKKEGKYIGVYISRKEIFHIDDILDELNFVIGYLLNEGYNWYRCVCNCKESVLKKSYAQYKGGNVIDAYEDVATTKFYENELPESDVNITSCNLRFIKK